MRLGISEHPEKGIKYYNEFERIFNNGKKKKRSLMDNTLNP